MKTASRARVSSVFVAALAALAFVRAPQPLADTLPSQLTDKEFWDLSTQSSEEDGTFRSDNLLSNEWGYQTIIPELLKRAKQDRVYLGVGPEQNFTYIAALHPKMVFLTDIRRGNLDLHLMYKALFELSADRAEFISRLFSKKRPEGLTAKSTSADLMNAYWTVPTDDALYKSNTREIEDLLTKKHGFQLKSLDVQGIEYVYYNFYWFGPSITYGSSQASGAGGRGGSSYPTYADLMVQTDGSTLNRGFLGSEENFRWLKEFEGRNMLVPVIGNFAGPKALRSVGKYIRDHHATVAASYLSNVEQYLYQDGIWQSFCANVATMPLDELSTFIRSASAGGGGPGGGLQSQLGNMMGEVRGCGIGGRPSAGGLWEAGISK
jgi:hypothetical protein